MSRRVAYELMAERCDECLVSKDRIVPGARAAELLRKVRDQDIKFICHKASFEGREIACRGVHDLTGGCRAYRMAKAFGIPVDEFDPATLERRPPDESLPDRPRGPRRHRD